MRFLAAVASVLLLSCLSVAQPPSAAADEARDKQELARLETVWNQAHEKGDADALAALWADDMEVAVPRMPVLTRADALSFAKSGRMKFQRYQTTDLHIRIYGDAALVTGRLQRSRTINEKQMEDDWRFTKVYVRQNGLWKVVAFHASEAAQP